jgi:undecaprenyl-diphosphatase
MNEFIKNNRNKIIIVLLIIIISIITTKIIINKPLKIDIIAYNFLVKKLRNPYLTIIMKAITGFCNLGGILFFTILSFIFIKDKKTFLTVPLNIVIATLINQVLKHIIRRPRPIGYRLIKIGGFSFPSGHAMVSMAFYGYLLYLSYVCIDNPKQKKASIIILGLIIILVGISRIYLGVHYCSDIITGYCISLLYLMIYIKTLKKIKIPK